MATVAPQIDVLTRADIYLPYLFAIMDELIEVDREWDDWDELSRLTYVVEWPIKADRLAQLAQWSKRGLLTGDQEQRYHELLTLLELRQPIIDRILAD